MPVQKLTIHEFLALAKTQPVIDVRSPGEFLQAHIPGAHNLPLFSDEERKIVGTAYKQQNRETAIKIGLDLFGPKMKLIVEEAEKIIADFNADHSNDSPLKPSTVLIHCARGGMRSAGVAWLLDLYGIKVYNLAGGYKAYRNWVLQQFEKEYPLKIIGGFTGSGKTMLLHELQKQGHAAIDLEALANHKGSALGGFGKGSQPKQAMFENLLAGELFKNADKEIIFLEDESQRIGNVQIPHSLWTSIRKSPVYFLDIPFETRLEYLTAEYKAQTLEELVNAVTRIQKRLGGGETKSVIGFLLEENYKDAFRILLKYYDKYYLKALHNRDEANLINKMSSAEVDAKKNAMLILSNALKSSSD